MSSSAGGATWLEAAPDCTSAARKNPLRESVAAGQATEELHTRLGYRVQELRDNSTPVVPPAVAQDAAKQQSQQPALAAGTNSAMPQQDQSSQVIKLPPPSRIPNASWLQPSDPQIQAALDSGFSGSKLSYRVFTFNPQKSKVSWSQHEITVEPPLVCAFAYGQIARSKLVEKPEFLLVKTDCYGKIVVIAVHVSQSLGANWPIVLERKGQRLQPSVTVPDPNPAVTRYSTFGGDVVGYQYQDRFAFIPPPDWTNDLDLTYADDSGKHHTVTVKTAMFEQ
jgi:hypothetical protein